MAYFYHNSETGETGHGGKPSKQEEEAGHGAEELTPEEIADL